MSNQEWPEFRRWYELILEEQRIYDKEDDKDHDRLLDALDSEKIPLEKAMLARVPSTPTEFAILGVIELRYAERKRNLDHDECRHLELGMMGDGCVPGRVLIEAVVRNAVSENLLPGVVVYGEGGNA
jgi:hypothetical protein